MFSSHGSGFDLLEGVDIDFLKIMILFFALQALEFASPRNDLTVNMLGALLNEGVDIKQGILGIENLFNPGAKFRPDLLGKFKIRA